MASVRDVNSLYNFIGYVVLRAPDQFPREDYLRDDEQLTLDKAFEELRAGVHLVQADFPERQVSGELQVILDESLALYRPAKESRRRIGYRISRLQSSTNEMRERLQSAMSGRSTRPANAGPRFARPH